MIVTVPVSHRLGLPLSQPVTTNVSMPVKAPVGIHSNAPSGPTVAVPCAAGVVSDAVTTCPASGSLIGTTPPSRWVGIQSTLTSSTTGGWLAGGAASTTVVTIAFGLEPSLFPGRPSTDVEVAETTATSVPDAGAVPVTVKIRVAPAVIVPIVHVTVPPPTTPPLSAADPAERRGQRLRDDHAGRGRRPAVDRDDGVGDGPARAPRRPVRPGRPTHRRWPAGPCRSRTAGPPARTWSPARRRRS